MALLVLAPLVWVVWAWQTMNGLPIFKDAYETWSSYVHARNLERFPLAQTWAITLEETGLLTATPPSGYLHNPNGPRYAH